MIPFAAVFHDDGFHYAEIALDTEGPKQRKQRDIYINMRHLYNYRLMSRLADVAFHRERPEIHSLTKHRVVLGSRFNESLIIIWVAITLAHKQSVGDIPFLGDYDLFLAVDNKVPTLFVGTLA